MITIDASVANKLVLPLEEGHQKAKKIFQRHATGTEIILTIDLIFYEVANTLSTKSSLPENQVTRSLTTIYKTGMKIYHPAEGDVKQASRLAKEFKTSVYDMLYAVAAKKHKSELITADGKFVGKTKFRFVKLLQEL